jgi:hypothetical protein
MVSIRRIFRIPLKQLRPAYFFGLVCSFAIVTGILACQITPAGAYEEEHADSPSAPVEAADDSGLVIREESQLPDTYPHARYSVFFHAQGGGSALHWRMEKGPLPPGLKLDDNGLLHGEPERAGEFRFTISVTEGGPQQAVHKEFVLRVVEALTLSWKAPARVNGNRIEGSVEVSNTTVDDVDLTFVVLAVAENGRATAIGYQHFPLRRATTQMELPFGESLPSGAYVVHVDVVGEVEKRNAIYRRRLQTPSPLRVTVGP